MVAAVVLSVVAFIAGHPTQVVCGDGLGGHATPGVIGWTAYGGNVIYVTDKICVGSNAEVGSDAFALGIGTLIHEAAHARGVRKESCAEMTADIGIYDVLRRFYNVPFFTPTSRMVGLQVLENTRRRPAEYQPEACWASGTVS